MFDEKAQRNLLELCISDKEIFTQVRTILQAKYFDSQFQKVVNYLLQFSAQYNSLPLFEQINNEARLPVPLKKIEGVEGNINVRQSILDTTEAFCKQRALELAVIECSERIAKGQSTGIDSIIKDAQKVSLKKDFGINFWENPKSWLEEQESEAGVVSTGWKALDDMLNGGFGWGELEYFIGCANAGKCESKGTRIRMFDGSVKNIEDIVVGDKLMGIDSTPRTVKALARGKEKLYEIDYGQGKMTVTGEHTLSLKVCSRGLDSKDGKFKYNLTHPTTGEHYAVGDIFNITVNDYLKTSNNFRRRAKLWRTPIEYPWQNTLIDPYLLGLWLGDGTSQTTEFTTMDKEIKMYLYLSAKGLDENIFKRVDRKNYHGKANTYRISSFLVNGKNPDIKYCYRKTHRTINWLLKRLQHYNLVNNKHIPNEYLYNNSEVRKALLAGIIDTDGYMSKSGIEYEICMKDTQLVRDVINLCQSLGYRVHIKEREIKGGKYVRLTIKGDLTDLPIKLERKKQKQRPFKAWDTSKFTIKQKDYEEDYYGFELDGDRLYIHEDGIVTHNSLVMQNIGLNFSRLGHTVLFFTLEMDMKLVGKRLTAMATDMPYKGIRFNIDDYANRIVCERMRDKPGTLQIVNIPIGCTINDIEAYTQEFELQTNLTPDIFIVDYADIMSPADKRCDVNNLGLVDNKITLELRNFVRERTHHGKPSLCITASQITKDAMAEEEFNMSNVAGGKAKSTNADNMVVISTSDAMREKGEYRFSMMKTRNSAGKGKKFKIKFNVDSLRMTDIEDYEEKGATVAPNSVENATSTAALNGVEMLKQKLLQQANKN